MTSLRRLDASLQSECLTILGHCPAQPEDGFDGTIVLIGPDEPLFWGQFTDSSEYRDGKDNPLDRWSKRVLTEIADSIAARALFPFGGPPYLPFYTWALRSGRFWPSPIGFLVHDKAGLFVSFRGAILVPDHIPPEHAERPCDRCADTPCRSACPVGAFEDSYAVETCKTHLSRPEGADCMAEGCRARRACPIGQGNRLPAQAAFHMKAFL